MWKKRIVNVSVEFDDEFIDLEFDDDDYEEFEF